MTYFSKFLFPKQRKAKAIHLIFITSLRLTEFQVYCVPMWSRQAYFSQNLLKREEGVQILIWEDKSLNFYYAIFILLINHFCLKNYVVWGEEIY